MIDQPLIREEIIAVIEGKGCARRVPNMVQFWVHPETYGLDEPRVRELMARYPYDVQVVPFWMPELYRGMPDAPQYRWACCDQPADWESLGIDERVVIKDWSQLEGILEQFPDPNYPGLFPENPAPDGRYRLGKWFFCFFERFWSLRGMTNALIDFYESPEQVHRLFDALCSFYCRIIERARQECGVDGIFTSDDLGTQCSTFFSQEIFDEFFKPYYRRLFDQAHRSGMHFWLHTCGNVQRFIPDFIELGLDVIHPIQKYTMDEAAVAREFGNDICIWAGFDVQQIIPWGTPAEVRQEVRFLIDTYFQPEGRLMLTAGNGINQDCPLSSLEALLDETIRYGAAIREKNVMMSNNKTMSREG